MKLVKTDPAQLDPYLKAGWQLIPVHRYDKMDEHKGKRRYRGKSPIDFNWTKKPYESKAQIKHMANGYNAGVRLRAEDLVIDVDPRNFPDDESLDTPSNPFSRLCEDAGIDVDLYPTVRTGSGGLHLYAKKPADISVRDSLDAYPGVEFKTLGRQVVSAGSVHPESKAVYDWEFLSPDLGAAPSIPDRLTNLIRRPQAVRGGSDGGEYDQMEVAQMLDVLDPEDFRNHDSWLNLMMACHHASGGDARTEFVEWSTRDPEYSNDGGSIGRRWDSLSAERSNAAAVTHRTLLKALTDRDLQEHIPRALAQDDFDDEPGVSPDFAQDFLPEHERKGPVEKMNDTHTAVIDGGKFKIYYQETDPEMDGRMFWQKLSAYDFCMLHKNRKVQKGDKTVNLADAWLEWGGRKTARGVIFDPERDHKGFLNLWRGWAVQPKKGGWDRLNDLLFECLCDGDQGVYDYVLNWSAHMVQKPGDPAEVAICFQGAKGVGKGTFLRALLWLCGRHGLQITSPDHLTGRFNSHLRDLIYLFADEAINPYDKSSESRLKGLITEPTLAIEAKGVDVRPAKNRLHIGMASNEDWFVPMGLDGERRFLLQKSNNKRAGQTTYFDKIYDQMKSGGLNALLFDLLNRDLKGWSPRECIPATAASTEQKLRGMTPIGQWWFNALASGDLGMLVINDLNWAIEPVKVFKQDVKDSFDAWCRQNGMRPGSSGRALEMLFAQELHGLIPGLNSKIQEPVTDDREYDIKSFSNGRAWAYEIPPLRACRKAIDVKLGFSYDWPTSDDDDWLN